MTKFLKSKPLIHPYMWGYTSYKIDKLKQIRFVRPYILKVSLRSAGCLIQFLVLSLLSIFKIFLQSPMIVLNQLFLVRRFMAFWDLLHNPSCHISCLLLQTLVVFNHIQLLNIVKQQSKSSSTSKELLAMGLYMEDVLRILFF